MKQAVKHTLISLLILSIFSSCAPKSHKGFVKRADAVYLAMIRVLENVEHPSDYYLLQALKPLYIEIAELSLLAQKQEEKLPELFSLEILEAPHQEALKQELTRVYNLEGGRQAVEAVARDGLVIMQKSISHAKKSSRRE